MPQEEEEEEGKVKEGMPGTKKHGSSHGLSLSDVPTRCCEAEL